MSIPKIQVSVPPAGPSTTERQLQYLELAPASTAFDPVVVLPLQLWLQNDQTTALHLDTIAVEFANATLNKTFSANLDVPAGQGVGWFATNSQYIVLPSPPPPSFKVTLSFTGFDPWADKVFLVLFPTSFRFPGKAADLGKKEFWLGKAGLGRTQDDKWQNQRYGHRDTDDTLQLDHQKPEGKHDRHNARHDDAVAQGARACQTKKRHGEIADQSRHHQENRPPIGAETVDHHRDDRPGHHHRDGDGPEDHGERG